MQRKIKLDLKKIQVKNKFYSNFTLYTVTQKKSAN